jgi:hypothetical protein
MQTKDSRVLEVVSHCADLSGLLRHSGGLLEVTGSYALAQNELGAGTIAVPSSRVSAFMNAIALADYARAH